MMPHKCAFLFGDMSVFLFCPQYCFQNTHLQFHHFITYCPALTSMGICHKLYSNGIFVLILVFLTLESIYYVVLLCKKESVAVAIVLSLCHIFHEMPPSGLDTENELPVCYAFYYLQSAWELVDTWKLPMLEFFVKLIILQTNLL